MLSMIVDVLKHTWGVFKLKRLSAKIQKCTAERQKVREKALALTKEYEALKSSLKGNSEGGVEVKLD